MIFALTDNCQLIFFLQATNGIEPEEGERKDIELLLDIASNKRDELEIVPYDPSLFHHQNNKDQQIIGDQQSNAQNTNEIDLPNANGNTIISNTVAIHEG